MGSNAAFPTDISTCFSIKNIKKKQHTKNPCSISNPHCFSQETKSQPATLLLNNTRSNYVWRLYILPLQTGDKHDVILIFQTHLRGILWVCNCSTLNEKKKTKKQKEHHHEKLCTCCSTCHTVSATVFNVGGWKDETRQKKNKKKKQDSGVVQWMCWQMGKTSRSDSANQAWK